MRFFLITLVAIAIAGCGSVKSTQKSENRFELRYPLNNYVSMAEAESLLSTRANELCPAGWSAKKQSWYFEGLRVLFWDVRCKPKT